MKYIAMQHNFRFRLALAMEACRTLGHLRTRGWRWLRDFADRRLERQVDMPSVRAALGSVLLRLANRALQGRLLMVSATGRAGSCPSRKRPARDCCSMRWMWRFTRRTLRAG